MKSILSSPDETEAAKDPKLLEQLCTKLEALCLKFERGVEAHKQWITRKTQENIAEQINAAL